MRWHGIIRAFGRFNTPDSHGGSALPGDPGSLNRYTYAAGDPANLNDPSGADSYCGPGGQCNGEGCYTTGGANEALYSAIYHTSTGGPCTDGQVLSLSFTDPAEIVACQVAMAGGDNSHPAPPPPPTCDVSLDSQSAIKPGFPYLHTLVQVSQISGGVVTTQDFEAGPSVGFLANKPDLVNGGSNYPGPVDLLFETGYSAAACTQGSAVKALANSFPNHGAS